jgi:hypothetical protein
MGRRTSPNGRPQIADPRRLFPWAQLDVAPSGAAMGVVLAERLTTSPDFWEFLLIELGRGS